MKKMLLAVFLIILVVFVFAGCINFSKLVDTTPTSKNDNFSQDVDIYTDLYNDQTTNNNNPVQTEPNNVDVPYSQQIEPSYNNPEQNTNNEEPSSNTSQEAPSQNTNIQNSNKNEYDILRSGNFHMTGSITDSSGLKTPMEIAVTPKSIYMLSDFSGAQMGMLVSNEIVYMVYPEKQAYLELTDSLMKMGGLDIDEIINSEQINFSSYGSLDSATSVSENEQYEGKTCQIYKFISDEKGETRIYMSGNKLIKLSTYDTNGKFLSSTDIDSISATVPNDKSNPPSSYKAYKGAMGMVSFMTLLKDVLE